MTTPAPAPGSQEHLALFMPLIHKQANYCLASLRKPRAYDHDDLVAEGILVYLRLVQDFDPSRGQFITPLYTRLGQHFGKLLHKTMRTWYRTRNDLEMDLFWTEDTPECRITALFAQPPTVDALRFVRAMTQGATGLALPEKANPVTRRKAVFEFLNIPPKNRSSILNEIRLKVGSRALG